MVRPAVRREPTAALLVTLALLAGCTPDVEQPVDTDAPSLVSSVPADGAVDVAPDATLSLTFDEPMDRATVTVTASPAYDFGSPTWSDDDRRRIMRDNAREFVSIS